MFGPIRISVFFLFIISACAVRTPSAIPFPHKEDIEFLTSDEEERLIYGSDMSVINSKLEDMPDQKVIPPDHVKELPVPTMDPPLPPIHQKSKRPPKSNRGFPFKIPRTFLSRMITPLNRKPRMKNVMPIPTYRSRPSTLVSSEPDELEMGFKRIEIMAARVGLNMSSMPRRTQMQVLKRLLPKLPPKMSSSVRNAMETNSEKMYHYLPEPIEDPLPAHQDDSYLNKYNFHNAEEEDFNSRPAQKQNFDAGTISLTHSGESSHAHEPHYDNFENGPSSGLLPPSDLAGQGDYASYDSYNNKGFRSLDLDNIHASPLVQDEFMEESENKPVIISANSKTKLATLVKSVTVPPVRVSSPTKDKITTRPTQRPIRVSIISKDAISINKTEPVVKVIHLEPVSDERDEKVSEVDVVTEKTLKTESPTSTIPPRVKEISRDIIEEEVLKYKKTEVKTTTTTETIPPELLKLDAYDDWSEDSENEQYEPYDLTEDEIAATVAELKKYEDEGVFDNSLEQEFPWRLAPHPLEYPDHPDHPKDSVEEVSSQTKQPEEEKEKNKINQPMRRPPFGPMRRPPFGLHGRRPPMRRPPFRPKPPMRRPLRPVGPRPIRINDVTVSEIPKEYNKECDYFSNELCLVVQDYPIEAISEAMEKHPDSSSLLVKEPEMASWVDGVQKAQESSYNFKHYFGIRRSEEETTHRHRDFAGEGGFLCPSKVAYGQVKKAKSSSTGEWKYVVNYGENTQTLRLEKCLSPGNTCSYVMPHYRTACTQVHNYHRLLAWDSEKGLHVDVFKIPTCCTCHVQGYYIPQQQHGFSPARRRDMPPRLKFSPPKFHQQQQRGSKKLPPPHPNFLIKHNPQKGPSKPILPPKIQNSANKELKDELQDLLAQYSALREKIAKKKQENVEVSYSVSISNSTESLRPKTRESRTSQLQKKPLLRLKKLSETLKKYNGSKPLVKAKLSRPMARALLLARLSRKLKIAQARSSRSRSLKFKSDAVKNSTGQNSTKDSVTLKSSIVENKGKDGSETKSASRIRSRIQVLRTRLNKFNERSHKRKKEGNVKRKNVDDDGDKSKVNYSYHPIMDYFNSKPGGKRVVH